jgi:hypothetical protein
MLGIATEAIIIIAIISVIALLIIERWLFAHRTPARVTRYSLARCHYDLIRQISSIRGIAN